MSYSSPATSGFKMPKSVLVGNDRRQPQTSRQRNITPKQPHQMSGNNDTCPFRYVKNPYGKEQYKMLVNFIGIRVIPVGEPCIINIYKKTAFFYKYNNTTPFDSCNISALTIPDNTTFVATMIQPDQCCIHDLVYYSGNYQYNSMKRLELLLQIFNDSFHQLQSQSRIIFGMCYLFETWQEFIRSKDQIYYPFSTIEYITTSTCNNSQQLPTRWLYKFKSTTTESLSGNTENQKVFMVKPDIQYDVYYLQDIESNIVEIAHIPDYKTSVMMNSIFRKIKENENLDALEESDDELEFQDCEIDKYVYLDKEIPMKCVYNERNKRWVPNKIVE
jgi:hypothetical protein